MARAVVRALRPQQPLVKVQAGPGLDVVPVTLWSPPKGINSTATLNRMPVQHALDIVNLMMDKGKLRTRYGIQSLGNPANVGDAGNDPIIDVVSFTTEGIGNLLRLTEHSMQMWDGQDGWNTVKRTGGVADVQWSHAPTSFSVTGWGGKLL